MRRTIVLTSLLTLASVPTFMANAAFVTTNEAGMDAVFSQASFGATPVDIRFNPVTNVENASLLNIDSEAKLTELFGLFGGGPTVYMYFVDTIDWCGGTNPSIVGCGTTPGNDIVVESTFAAGPYGTELNAHELGHNLGLGHLSSPPDNLMNPSLNGNTDLNSSQVTSIFGSSLVQTDGGGDYILITPVLISGGTVPEPPSIILLAIGMIGWIGYRRSKHRTQHGAVTTTPNGIELRAAVIATGNPNSESPGPPDHRHR